MKPTTLIQIDGIDFSYPPLIPGEIADPVFNDLFLTLKAGECLALMGANGAGKTTLCRVCTALAPQMTGGELEGKAIILTHNISQIRPADIAGQVGSTFQEVEHQLFNATVESEVAWGLEALGLEPVEIEKRIDWALQVVGLEVERGRSPALLSGGQQKRLALAVAISIRPLLLVLDEPLGGLDPTGRKEVLEALTTLRQETRAGVLITESMPDASLALADRIAILADGKIVLQDSRENIFAQVDRLDELGIAIPQLARLSHALVGPPSSTIQPFLSLAEAEKSIAPILLPPESKEREGKEMLHRHRPTLPVHSSTDAAQDPSHSSDHMAIQFEGVSFQYPNGPTVLDRIDMTIAAGQFVALVGANGSGKTTLAKQIIGLLRPTGGQVFVNGADTSTLSVGEIARHVGYLFQHPERQIFATTIRDEVAFGPRNLVPSKRSKSKTDSASIVNVVNASLDRFGLASLADAPPAVLSYALRRLVTLASVAAMEPAIVVLDEPTVGLDARGTAITLGWCREMHALGRSVLMITHDMTAAAQAERIIVLEAGRIIADAPPADLFWRPEILSRAALEPPPISALAQRLGMPTGIVTIEEFITCLGDSVQSR